MAANAMRSAQTCHEARSRGARTCSPTWAKASTNIQYEHSMCTRRAQLAPGSTGRKPNACFEITRLLAICPTTHTTSPAITTICTTRSALCRPRNMDASHLRLKTMWARVRAISATPSHSWGASCTKAVAITATSVNASALSNTIRITFLLFMVLSSHARRSSIYAFAETHSSMLSVLDAALVPISESPSRTSAPGHAAERSERQLANPLPACVLKG